MRFWFGKIDTSALAARIVRYCGIGWIIWACLCVAVTFLSEAPVVLLGAVFGLAAARAYFEHSRTATTIVFGIVAICAGANILEILASGSELPLLKAMWIAVLLLIILSAFRVVKAIEFLNAEDLKPIETA